MAEWMKGLPHRVREEEVRASITTTKTDRIALHKRLDALETARSITGNKRKGLNVRLLAIEAAALILALLLPALAHADVYGSALVRYEATDPSGGCTNRRLWWNTSSNVLWICESGTWISTLGAVPAPSPFTGGTVTTTVTSSRVCTLSGGGCSATTLGLNFTSATRDGIGWISGSYGGLYVQSQGPIFTLATDPGMDGVGVRGALFMWPASAGSQLNHSDGSDNVSAVTVATGSATLTYDPSGANTFGVSVTAGGVKITTTASKPTCDSGTRGRLWRTEGGAGVADTLEVCRKDSGDAYAWTALF